MNPSDFQSMLTKFDNKENVPPSTASNPNERANESKHSTWQMLKQQVPFIQTAITKFIVSPQQVNHEKMWEIESDTYFLEHDYVNTFIAKCTLYQAMFLSPTQIPVVLIRVLNSEEKLKILFRITALIVKIDDLSPCIFHIQIQPEIASAIPICSLPSHKELITLILLNSPLLPKSVILKMRDMLTGIEAVISKT